jgi:cyclopropane-fatty-acyl-phospholipid synthase
MEFPIELDRIARNEVSDHTIRSVMRYGLSRELHRRAEGGAAAVEARKRAVIEQLRIGPLAVEQDAANAQHYEVDPELFELCLGSRCKYSCCYYGPGVRTLDEAELAMLSRSVEMARLQDGQRVLELGCGWGSLTLYMAARYPNSEIVAVSNSRPQRETILRKAKQAGLANIDVVTTDVTTWGGAGRFDRIVSVEMLEHLRNYAAMFERIAGWMAPGALFFAHIFVHREHAYTYEQSWTASRFFSGGTMPSFDLFSRYPHHLRVVEARLLDGTHYQKTSEAWLENLDRNREGALAVLERGRTREEALREFAEWRLFYLITAESFGFASGQEWGIGHYLLEASQ